MTFFERPYENGNNMRSRWIELAYYDEDLQPLNSTLRDEAVYIVRYGIYISSLDGKININPDFDVIPYDSGLSPTTQSQENNNYDDDNDLTVTRTIILSPKRYTGKVGPGTPGPLHWDLIPGTPHLGPHPWEP